jgi:hypothetical protein
MDQSQHSVWPLLISFAGLLLELVGGFLLAMEDIFKVKDSNKLRNELKTVTHPAMKGIPWLGYGIVLTSATDAEKIAEKVKEIGLKYNQKRARLGFLLLFIGIVVHGIERCLTYGCSTILTRRPKIGYNVRSE